MHTKKYLFNRYLANDASWGKEINTSVAKQAKPENKCSVDKTSVSHKLKKIHLDIRKTNV